MTLVAVWTALAIIIFVGDRGMHSPQNRKTFGIIFMVIAGILAMYFFGQARP